MTHIPVQLPGITCKLKSTVNLCLTAALFLEDSAVWHNHVHKLTHEKIRNRENWKRISILEMVVRTLL